MPVSTWYCFDCGTWAGYPAPIVPVRICICADSYDAARAWYDSLLSVNGGPCYNFDLGDPFAGKNPPSGWPPACPDGVRCWKIVCADGSSQPFIGSAGDASAKSQDVGAGHDNGCVYQPEEWNYCFPEQSSSSSGGAIPQRHIKTCNGKIELLRSAARMCGGPPPITLPDRVPCTTACIDGTSPREWVVTLPNNLFTITDPVVVTGFGGQTVDFSNLPDYSGTYGLTPQRYFFGFPVECFWTFGTRFPFYVTYGHTEGTSNSCPTLWWLGLRILLSIGPLPTDPGGPVNLYMSVIFDVFPDGGSSYPFPGCPSGCACNVFSLQLNYEADSITDSSPVDCGTLSVNDTQLTYTDRVSAYWGFPMTVNGTTGMAARAVS